MIILDLIINAVTVLLSSDYVSATGAQTEDSSWMADLYAMVGM